MGQKGVSASDIAQKKAGRQPAGHAARRLAPSMLATVVLIISLHSIDPAMVATSLATIATDLNQVGSMTWVITVYLITATATVPVYGRLSDHYGRKPAIFIAVQFFIAGAVVSSLSQSLESLLIGRAIQGLGGGGLFTLALTLIADNVTPRRSGVYLGLVTAVFGLAGLAGTVLGGLVTQFVGWNAIFWLEVPLGILILGFAFQAISPLPKSERSSVPIDWLGALVLAFIIVLALLALELLQQGQWQMLLAAVAAGAGAALMLKLLVRIEQQVKAPMFRIKLLMRHELRKPALLQFFARGINFGVLVYAPLTFQFLAGIGPALTGVLMAVFPVSMAATALAAGKYIHRHGRYRVLPIFGFCVCAFSFFLFAVAHDLGRLFAMILALSAAGVGMGSCYPGAAAAMQNVLRAEDRGTGMAFLRFAGAIGSLVGLALLSLVFHGTLVLQLGRDQRQWVYDQLSELGRNGGPHRALEQANPDMQEMVTSTLSLSFTLVFLSALLMCGSGLWTAMKLKEEKLRTRI